MHRLFFKEKLFCECMSLVMAGWWLFLVYLLYILRGYLLIGILIAIGVAVGVAFFEVIRGKKDVIEDEEHI